MVQVERQLCGLQRLPMSDRDGRSGWTRLGELAQLDWSGRVALDPQQVRRIDPERVE